MFATRVYRFLLRRRFNVKVSPDECILIVTRSMNDTLYGWSQSLLTLPYGRRRIVGLNRWRNAADYLHLLFEFPVEWIINIDEDCFVFNNERLSGLLAHMQEHGYDF